MLGNTIAARDRAGNALQSNGFDGDRLCAAQEAIARGDGWQAAEMFARGVGQAPGLMGSLRATARLAQAASGLGPQSLRQYLTACFAAGTPILWEFGEKPIEDFQPGDRVWARHEETPEAQPELKPIEECFISEAQIWNLRVGPQLIRTTDEHPFYVVGKGWTAAKKLARGDLLIGRDGEQTVVEDVSPTEEFERVYNFRVAEYHTYFVGSKEWGFEVWAHNACVQPVVRAGMNPRRRRTIRM